MSEKSQSIKSDRISKSSIARIAGNVAAGLVERDYDYEDYRMQVIAERSVKLARLIAAEVEGSRFDLDAWLAEFPADKTFTRDELRAALRGR